ncbi:MAG: hypothetical protein ACI4LX_01165 [Treponema sp.]
MTLDERIKQDLTELYEGKEISSAKELQSVIEVSTKGLPQHFVGKRDAKTVFVHLNPGKDVKKADEDFASVTARYDRSSASAFIESYHNAKIEFGNDDKDRRDSFDEKQAAFLKYFEDSGVEVPENFPEERTDELCLLAKQNVIMQKCQLELIPYCSAQFNLKTENLEALVPYAETLLDEIFRVERKYVIFGSRIFADLFKKMQSENIKVEFLKDAQKNLGFEKSFKAHLVKITKDGKSIVAVIACTFMSWGIVNAYDVMAEYGKMCFELLKQ